MRTYLLFFIVLLSITSEAQNPIIKETRYTQKVTIASGSNSSPDAHSILNRLALGNNKNIRSTQFFIEFDQKLIINSREPLKIYRIENAELRFTGDVRYKGFDMVDFLSPNKLTYDLKFVLKSGVAKSQLMKSTINNFKPESTDYSSDDASYEFSSQKLENHTFYYNSTTKNNFEEQANYIDEYYKQIINIEQGFQLLRSINPNQIDDYQLMQRRLSDSKSILQYIEQQNFANNLELNRNDPAQLQPKLSAYQIAFNNKEQECLHIWNNLYIAFYERGLLASRNRLFLKAKDDFFTSLRINPSFAPALLQLAILDFRAGELEESSCKADDIIYNLNPDPETKQETFNLLNEIYEAYVEEGNIYLKKLNYNVALKSFNDAEKICKKYSVIRCTNELNEGFKSALNGKYNLFLDKARNEVSVNNLNQAELEVNNALKLQRENSNFIVSNKLGVDMLQAIKQKRYDALIGQGKNLTQQKKYNEALLLFGQADSLLYQFHLNEASSIKEIQLSAARPLIEEKISNADEFSNKNDLLKARMELKYANDLQARYSLQNDSIINSKTDRIRKKVNTQECLNFQNEIDKLFKQGQEYIDQGQFLSANTSLESAMKIASKNTNCMLVTDNVVKSLGEIKPAVNYLTLLQKSKDAESNGDYRNSLIEYSKATQYYKDLNVASFGLVHEDDQYRYVRDQGSNGLRFYTADLYTETGKLDQALLLYKLLLVNNYESKNMSSSLYNLGFKTGELDKKKGIVDRKKEVKKYTASDKNLKRFEKGYKKGMK